MERPWRGGQIMRRRYVKRFDETWLARVQLICAVEPK